MNFFEKICKENDLIVKSFRDCEGDKICGFYHTSFDMKKTSLIWSIPISNYENIYGIIYPDKERLKVLTDITFSGGNRLLVQGHWTYIKYEEPNLNEYIRKAKIFINKYKLYYDLSKQEEKSQQKILKIWRTAKQSKQSEELLRLNDSVTRLTYTKMVNWLAVII